MVQAVDLIDYDHGDHLNEHMDAFSRTSISKTYRRSSHITFFEWFDCDHGDDLNEYVDAC